MLISVNKWPTYFLSIIPRFKVFKARFKEQEFHITHMTILYASGSCLLPAGGKTGRASCAIS